MSKLRLRAACAKIAVPPNGSSISNGEVSPGLAVSLCRLSAGVLGAILT
jgi:hypothetical protein